MASEAAFAPSRPGGWSVSAARAFLADQARRLARIAFALTVILSPFDAGVVLVSRPVPPIYSGYTDLTLPVGGIALLATLALWVVSLAARPRSVSLGPAFLYLPLAGLIALAWLSVPSSIDAVLSAYNAVELLALAGLALYVLNEVDSVAALAVPIAAMVAIQSVVALGQLVEQRSIGLQALGELGLAPSQPGASVVAASGIPRLLRGYGLTQHPNILGGLLAFALPLFVLGRPWMRPGDRLHAATRAGAVVLALAGLFATFSRAAWLAAAVGFAAGLSLLLLRRARPHAPTDRRVWVTIGAGAVLLIALALPYGRYVGIRFGVADAPSVTETMSLGERTILADQVLRLAAAHPLTGAGLAALPEAVRQSDPGLTFDFQPAHVVLLDVAAELGVLAALLYALLLVAPWLALLRRRNAWTRDLAAASGALAAVTVAGLFDYYTWTWSPGRIWAWLVLAMWAGAYVRSISRPSDAR